MKRAYSGLEASLSDHEFQFHSPSYHAPDLRSPYTDSEHSSLPYRSKSEKIIADIFETEGIKFGYEDELHVPREHSDTLYSQSRFCSHCSCGCFFTSMRGLVKLQFDESSEIYVKKNDYAIDQNEKMLQESLKCLQKKKEDFVAGIGLVSENQKPNEEPVGAHQP